MNLFLLDTDMKTIYYTTTLFHYDGPQIFEARDATDRREPMKEERKIRTEATSKSINKWVGKFEDAFGIKADKGKPTKRMKSIIEKLNKKMRKLKRRSRKKS